MSGAEDPRGRPGPGALHLVVGPSGAGKDMLIDAARAARRDIVFPRRVITRPASAGGEAHEGVDEAEFARREAAGGFLLSWRAHGLAYGIPSAAGAALIEGRHVLVNVSRGVIGQARARWRPLRVLAVTAPAHVRARRLAGRGRESAAEIESRLARAGFAAPEGADVIEIDNGGAAEDAVAAFLAALAPADEAPGAILNPDPARDRTGEGADDRPRDRADPCADPCADARAAPPRRAP